MVSKKNLFVIIFFIVQFCFGQFFYTGSHQIEFLENIKKNQKDLNEIIIKNRYNYEKNKFIEYKNINHFGLFVNLKNKTNSNIIHEKADLIGNGVLTNYRFSLPRFEVANSMFFTYDSKQASKGFVRTIKNITMYTNQSYFKYNNNIDSLFYSLKLGRDFLIEGQGNSSKIFFSDYSRPFDQLTIEARYKNLISKISTITLDKMNDHKRYLYMHTFGLNFAKLNFTIGEAVVSTGINESLDIKFLNPFNFWSWENVGSSDKGLNAFLYSSLLYKFSPSMNLYVELLIDDINFHQKNAFYLNRYAYNIGIEKIGFPFNSSILWIESSNVLNQVYQSYHPSHTFIHRGYPIGHYLGNDFLNHRIHYSQLLKSKLNKIFFELSFLTRGQNNLDTPFDNPWEDSEGKFNENYKHLGFPTPPLNIINDFDFGFEFELRNKTYLILGLESQKNSKKNIIIKLRLKFWSYINFIK